MKTISLNSLSKWEARNYPTVKDNFFKAGKLAQHELFTFAALLTLYSGKSGFQPDDTAEFVEFIQKSWNSEDIVATVEKIVKSNIFTVDFSEVEGFVEGVAKYVADIEELGMKEALNKFLA